MQVFKPTKEELVAARGKSVPDVITPSLRILFCGINPGLYSAATGHHFARPGNRFWPVLHAAGFTDRLLSPFEEQELLKRGYGITNIVNRPTANAAELSLSELQEGAKRLSNTILKYKPRIVAVLGVEAYRKAFGHREVVLGPRDERIGDSVVWILPNPSGINAHYQVKELAALFKKLRLASDKPQ
ncbi:MAG TPA: G/U mismatch-specific DNA glycosylase [Syntrophorhabdales bacterium]|nr:G/U mismatch-specific DNA glycosylase [Syntrophorhabdales bacterium]